MQRNYLFELGTANQKGTEEAGAGQESARTTATYGLGTFGLRTRYLPEERHRAGSKHTTTHMDPWNVQNECRELVHNLGTACQNKKTVLEASRDNTDEQSTENGQFDLLRRQQ